MSGHHSPFSMTLIWHKKGEKRKNPLTPNLARWNPSGSGLGAEAFVI